MANIINIMGIVLVFIVAILSLKLSNDKKNHYIEYARFPIVIMYCSIGFIVSIILLILRVQSVAISLSIQIAMFVIFVATMLVLRQANKTTQESIAKDNENYNKIEILSNKLELILNSISDRDIYKKVEKAYDTIKNANLTNKTDVSAIDDDLMNEINLIEQAVQKNKFVSLDKSIDNINKLVALRNQK